MRFLVPYLATHVLRPFQRYFPDMLWRRDEAHKTAYLTFDDGPTATMTEEILDILATYSAQATFFLIGRHAADHPDLVRRLHRAGHTLGNHTHTHPNAWSLPSADLRMELSRSTETIEQIAGTRVDVMRPPYGKFTGAMRTWCAERQQRMVMWDVMPGDYLRTATADRVDRFVRSTIRPGSIIVLHDNPICEGVTPPALDALLRRLTAEGWTFEAL